MLDPLDSLLEHFSSPPSKHLHIIVELPPAGEYPRHPYVAPFLTVDVLFAIISCSSLHMFMFSNPFVCLTYTILVGSSISASRKRIGLWPMEEDNRETKKGRIAEP